MLLVFGCPRVPSNTTKFEITVHKKNHLGLFAGAECANACTEAPIKVPTTTAAAAECTQSSHEVSAAGTSCVCVSEASFPGTTSDTSCTPETSCPVSEVSDDAIALAPSSSASASRWAMRGLKWGSCALAVSAVAVCVYRAHRR